MLALEVLAEGRADPVVALVCVSVSRVVSILIHGVSQTYFRIARDRSFVLVFIHVAHALGVYGSHDVRSLLHISVSHTLMQQPHDRSLNTHQVHATRV